MKTSKKMPAARSVVTYGMIVRHHGSRPMKHRASVRGGAKNKQAAYQAGEY